MTDRSIAAVALTCSCLMAASLLLKADVREDEKSRIEFAGPLGGVVNFFGGKAAREGVTSTVAVKGDRKARLSETTGQIIDLSEEKIYELDMRRKTYKVVTFEEMRRRMEEARRKAEENAQKQEARERRKASEGKDQPEMEVDFDLKDTDQKKVINGFDTHEVVMTITIREKGKTLDEAGGMVLTSDMWMASSAAATREIADFDRRYFSKLGPVVAGASEDQMAAAMAMYPHMKEAFARMNAENVKLDGALIQTTTKMAAVKSAQQTQQEQQSEQRQEASSTSSSPSGMLGRLMAKKLAQKKEERQDENQDQPGRATIMTITNEVLKVTTDVSAADVAIPAGFKESR
jgi:hypothetical protein